MWESLFTPVHLIIIFAILILLFGAKKLPDLGKGIGSGIREFRSGIASVNEEPKSEQLPAAGEMATPPTSGGPKAAE
jgi:sec-independent protein translocase protein TatA